MAAVALAASWAPSALACIAIPPPFDPRGRQLDAVVAGRVVGRVTNRSIVSADIAVRRVVSGRYPAKTVRVEWDVGPYAGQCPPTSAPLQKGQYVTVYLARWDGKLVAHGWIVTGRGTPGRLR